LRYYLINNLLIYILINKNLIYNNNLKNGVINEIHNKIISQQTSVIIYYFILTVRFEIFFCFYITTKKLINTNTNINKMFLSINYSEFYRWNYSLSIFRGNYSGKKIITKPKSIMTCYLYQQNYQQ